MLHDPRRETKTKARLVLNAAADYIEEHGWCQRVLHINGRVCLFGAVSRGLNCYGLTDASPVYGEVLLMLRKVVRTASMVAWNDAAGRTKEQVVKALRKAASA